MLSSVRVYGEHHHLAFFLYGKQLAGRFFASQVRGKRHWATAHVMARSSQSSAGYLEVVHDALAGLVPNMLARSYNEKDLVTGNTFYIRFLVLQVFFFNKSSCCTHIRSWLTSSRN